METKLIPVEVINPPPEPIRISIDPDRIQSLAKSIKSLGLLQPIVVVQKGKKYEIIAGHRRYLACKKIKLRRIPALISEEPDEKRAEMMLAENLIREDLSPVEVALVISKMRHDLGYATGKIASKLGKTTTWVRNQMKILDYPDDIQQALHFRGINAGVAGELAKIEDKDDRLRYTGEAIENGSSKKVVKYWVDTYLQTKEIIDRAEPREISEIANDFPTQGVRRCELCGEKYYIMDLRTVFMCPRCMTTIAEVRRQEIERDHTSTGNTDTSTDDVDKIRTQDNQAGSKN